MNDVIVFAVGLLVSILVVFGLFTRVVVEMREAKERDEVAHQPGGEKSIDRAATA